MISARIAEFEKQCRIRSKNSPGSHFNEDYHSAALTRFADLPRWEKAARSMAYAITNQEIYAYPDDTIGGRVYHIIGEVPSQIDPDFDEITPAAARFAAECPDVDILSENYLLGTVIKGHITWFYNHLLSLGITGFRARVEKKLAFPKDEEAVQFYKGVLILLDALQEFNDKHIAAYEAIGNTELAERMRKVPRYPAETFREAVQAFFIQHVVVMKENPFGGNGPGRLDYYLWPYLERDLKNGTCTLEEAKEIIDELFLLLNERLFDDDMWVEALSIGGTHPNGSSAVNPLTYIMIRSIIDLDITHPSVYVRLPENPPDDLVTLCAEYMMSGRNRAQILYDPSIIGALVDAGMPYRDAVEYACGGCMEISAQGMTSDYLYVGWQNIPKMLELMVTGGICLRTGKPIPGFNATKSLAGYDDFESFYQDFIAVVNHFVRLYLHKIDIYSEELQKARPSYLLSSMVDNCLETGRNLHAGGAKYHDYGVSPVGMPNVADGLHAIKVAVFEKKICTADELIAAMKANYVGYERLQNELKAIPKYGVDDDDADAMAVRVCSDISDAYRSYRTRWGGNGKPVVMTFVYSPLAASLLGATPDGRNLGGSLAYGTTPQSCAMTEGITAAINSCGKLPHNKFSGGASTMWDFDNAWATTPIIEALLRVFMDNNAQIFQGNTSSLADLIKAQEDPDNYGNIVVRVGGYSARFGTLPRDVQNDIIARIRHAG